MEQKIKFIIIGLIVFSVACLLLFFKAVNQQQTLARESNALKSENNALLNKVNQLENDLKENQGKIDSLKNERDKASAELKDLQNKFDLASKARDELAEKLQKQSQRQETAEKPTLQVPEGADAYWGEILKSKTDLELQLANIRTELRNLQINNESLQRDKAALEIDINSLRNEKKDLIRQLDYNQKLLDSMSQEVVRERNDKSAIQDSLKTIRAENDLLSRQLKSLSSRKISLDQKIQALAEGKDTVDKRLSEMETMLTDKISQIDSLKTELDAIKSGKAVVSVEKKRESVELPAIVVRSSANLENNKAEIAEYPGKILAVNTDSNFVVIDLGISSGAKVGDEFNVYRAQKLIGSIAVIQARDNISACDIKKVSTALKVGDSVK